MRSMASFRLLLLVAVMSVSLVSLNTFVMLPAVVVSDPPQQLLQSAFATFPGENGKIAFSRYTDSCCISEIYVMNADGTEQTRLTTTDDNYNDLSPDWSPDGTKIAFYRDIIGRQNVAEIYVMNADGTEQTNISNNPAYDFDPSWSPDGTKIAFTTQRGDNNNNNEIFVMNADGTEQTNISNNPANDFGPDWSPDGTKIAFASDRDAITNREIYVMNADGTNLIRLTNDPADETWPSWSPDGTKIAFQSQIEGDNEVVFVMNADGTEQTRRTDNQAGVPSWSPDGTKIAFVRNGQIYVMNADGTEQTNISNNSTLDTYPDWGPAIDTEPPSDTMPPTLTLPDDITAQATTANGGTVVTYNVTAEDDVDGTAILEEDNTITQDDDGGDIDISCEPASGTEFGIGDTTVECIATDVAGNQGTGSFTVTILPPEPDPLTAELTASTTEGDAPLTVEFQATVTGGTEPYSYSWDFGDGTTEEGIEPTALHTYEEPGTYTVTVTVTDANSQQASDSIEIIVNEPPPPTSTPEEAIEDLITDIRNLEGVRQGTKAALIAPLERALGFLTDDNPRNDQRACNRLDAFLDRVDNHERRNRLTAVQADDLRTQAEDIRDMLGCR